MNESIDQLLQGIKSGINVDPRVFSNEVLPQDQFEQPFDAWVKNAIDMYLRPEFERYQYNPYMQNAANQMGEMNQNIGLTGAWRNARSGVDLDQTAQAQMMGREQLLSDYANQALGVRDAFKSSWSDPLYRSRMEQFYNSPTRSYSGDQPATTPGGTPATSAAMGNPFDRTNSSGSMINATRDQSAYNRTGGPVAYGGPATPDDYMGQQNFNVGQYQLSSPYNTNLISQYLRKPTTMSNPYNLLSQA
jgi:hypothetical protein